MRRIATIFLLTFLLANYASANEQAGIDQVSMKPISPIGTNSFEECAAVTMWTFSGKSINSLVDAAKESEQSEATTKIPRGNKLLGLGSSSGTVKIPKGWSVVGTSFSNGEPLLFICR